MKLVEKYFLGFEPMPSVLPKHYSTAKWEALYRIWTDDLCLTMALLYHWVKRAFYSKISHVHLPLWVYRIMYMFILYVYINVHNIYIYRDICIYFLLYILRYRSLFMARFKILIKSRKIRKSFIFSLNKIREQRVDTLKNGPKMSKGQ